MGCLCFKFREALKKEAEKDAAVKAKEARRKAAAEWIKMAVAAGGSALDIVSLIQHGYHTGVLSIYDQ